MKHFMIATLIICSIPSPGQSIKNLVFEGGGVRGISFAGAIGVLEENNLLMDVEKVGGTSVGAITALTLSLRYNAKEIEEIIAGTNPGKFNDGVFLLFGGSRRLRNHYGWYKGKAFTRWAANLIEMKTGNSESTFRELHERKFKDLYVTGTSLNNQKVIVFSHETYPDMKVKDAIRISMSIPFVFQAVFIDSAGRILDKKERSGNYDIMVDGGFISNFPIQLFDDRDSTNRYIANPFTLGFRMDAKDQLAFDQQRKGLAPVPVHSLKNYIGAFFNFIMENLNRANLTEQDWDRTVSISAERVGPKVKKVTKHDRELLIQSGRLAMEQYLQKRPRN
jgi:NTE family protein